MRSTRIFSALVAVALTLTMSLAFNAPTATGAMQKPKHDLTANGKEIGNTGRFKVTGKVSTFKGKTIKVQRKLKGKNWQGYKETKTKNSDGHYSVNIDGPLGACFRVVVPKTKNYRKTMDNFGCIVKQ